MMQPESAVIRRLRCSDQPDLRRFFAGLGSVTLFQRFHAPIRAVPERFFAGAFAPVHPMTQAVVAVADGSIVGLSRLVPAPVGSGRVGAAEPGSRDARVRVAADTPVGSADLAVVVADRYRRRGIARRLVEALASPELRGWRLRADIQPDNVAALSLARLLAPRAPPPPRRWVRRGRARGPTIRTSRADPPVRDVRIVGIPAGRSTRGPALLRARRRPAFGRLAAEAAQDREPGPLVEVLVEVAALGRLHAAGAAVVASAVAHQLERRLHVGPHVGEG